MDNEELKEKIIEVLGTEPITVDAIHDQIKGVGMPRVQSQLTSLVDSKSVSVVKTGLKIRRYKLNGDPENRVSMNYVHKNVFGRL